MTGHRAWARFDADAVLIGATTPPLGATGQVVVAAGAALESVLQWFVQLLNEADCATDRFRPDSEISRLYADLGDCRKVSSRLAGLLKGSLVWARRTHGLVDPPVGAALGAAGYENGFASMARVQVGRPPQCVPVPGWWRVSVNGTRVTRPAGVALDVGTTAKAQLADEAARALSEFWSGPVLVSLGGDVATAGSVPWADG
jgi:thiamine biosynthesis lipoprotein